MPEPDYKAMYYHLAGRNVLTVDTLDVTVNTLIATVESLVTVTRELAILTEKLKKAQQTTEEMFISAGDETDA